MKAPTTRKGQHRTAFPPSIFEHLAATFEAHAATGRIAGSGEIPVNLEDDDEDTIQTIYHAPQEPISEEEWEALAVEYQGDK